MKQFSPNAILALKEALTNIYWKKQDLRSFVYHSIENKLLIATIDWDNNKKAESAGILIDRMVARPDLYGKDLFRLFDVVMHFNDFTHLNNGMTRIKNSKGKRFGAALRKHADGYFQTQRGKRSSRSEKNCILKYAEGKR